ncbi:MAG: hydrogenase iron-sulfur subunit [Thermoanaerobacterales bacterium]|nr:hydrogenase iron-sulfur subunit [Thermoanaerobacterales bacterium]
MPESTVCESGLRIGVFVCDCESTLDEALDIARLARYAGSLPYVAFVRRHGHFCEEGLAAFRKDIAEHGLNRVIVAGCSPRTSLAAPEQRFKRAAAETGLDTAAVEIANIREQCAWVHPGAREAATGKAMDILTMAHARVLLNRERRPARLRLENRALVIGGGPAGMQAALDYARNGVKVTLVEKSTHLGGQTARVERLYQTPNWPSTCSTSCILPNITKLIALHGPAIELLTSAEVTGIRKVDGNFEVTIRQKPRYVDSRKCVECGRCAAVCPVTLPSEFAFGLSTRKAIYKPYRFTHPDAFVIDAGACTGCGRCVPACPAGAIALDARPREKTVRAGSVVVATGFEELDVQKAMPESAGRLEQVLSSLEFEQYGQYLDRMQKKPRSITFVLCAGSREADGGRKDRPLDGPRPYCSKICCEYTLKQVLLVKKALPEVEINVVYTDIRTVDRAPEEYYREAQRKGVNFIRGRLAAVEKKAGAESVTLRCQPLPAGNAALPGPAEMLETDLVVLATAFNPHRDSSHLRMLFGMQPDKYGFAAVNQGPFGDSPGCRILRPTESTVHRVYVVGGAAGPASVHESAAAAGSAVARALPYHHRGYTELLDYYALVDKDRCNGCGFCQNVCPHGAIQKDEDGYYSTDPAFCQACGLCLAACPSGAVQLTNYTEKHLEEQLKVAFRHVPPGEPKILGYLCYWCSYSGADFAGINRLEYPVGTRIIRVRCGGSVSPVHVLMALSMGADGVVVGRCPDHNCHHHHGNELTARRMAMWEKMLPTVEIDKARFASRIIGSAGYKEWINTVREMHDHLKKLKAGAEKDRPEAQIS